MLAIERVRKRFLRVGGVPVTRSRSFVRGFATVLAAVLSVSAIAPYSFADAYDAAMARAVAAKE